MFSKTTEVELAERGLSSADGESTTSRNEGLVHSFHMLHIYVCSDHRSCSQPSHAAPLCVFRQTTGLVHSLHMLHLYVCSDHRSCSQPSHAAPLCVFRQTTGLVHSLLMLHLYVCLDRPQLLFTAFTCCTSVCVQTDHRSCSQPSHAAPLRVFRQITGLVHSLHMLHLYVCSDRPQVLFTAFTCCTFMSVQTTGLVHSLYMLHIYVCSDRPQIVLTTFTCRTSERFQTDHRSC